MRQFIKVSSPLAGVKLLQLNRPKQLNSLNTKILQELAEELEESDLDSSIKCNIIVGQKGFFAVGADIKELNQYINADDSTRKSFEIDYFERISSINKPIIVAVDGMAFGGGFELILCCDIILATKNSTFCFPEVKLGLMPGKSGTQKISKIVGIKKAMGIVLCGSTIDAEQAEKMNIINNVYENDSELEEAVIKFGKILSRSSPKAIKFAKKAVKMSEELSITEGVKYEFKLFMELLNDKDQHEGIRAFLEKRRPNWKL